ncbi:unnamed protein product [Sphagnum tenellum]
MASPRQEKDKKRRRPGGEGGVIEEVGTGIKEGVVDCRIDEGKVQAFKIRLTRKGDAFSILKLEKETADENGGDGGANNLASKRDEGLAKQVTPNMAKEIQERDGETEKEISEPANKRTKHGKNSMPQIVSESGGYGGQEGNYPGMEDSLLHGAFATHSNTTSQKDCVGGAGKPVPSVSVSEGAKAFQDGVASAVLGTGTMQQANTAENTASRESLVQEIYPIPSHAGWFVWNKIHSLERRSLSEFFDQKAVSKTPKIYKEYRDFIINKYRENPHRPLKFTEVRRMLIGDVNSLRRVFDFLEHWGLINHQVLQDSETKAAGASSPVPVPMVVDSLPSGIRVVPSPVPSPSKTQSSVVLDASDGSVGALRSNSLATHKSVYTSASRHSVSDDASGASNKPEAEILCHICKGECSKQRFYHRRVGISLCVGCFKNGKLPVGTTVGEFIRIEAGVRAPTKEWSSKENLLLLEALLSYGDNWNQVAQHVRSRTGIECVKQFIQLPFGDQFISESHDTNGVVTNHAVVLEEAKAVSAASSDGISMSSRVKKGEAVIPSTMPTMEASEITERHDFVTPFADSTHPLFSQVAMLAAMVAPRVAAAAAEAAIGAIAEVEPALIFKNELVSFLVFIRTLLCCAEKAQAQEPSSISNDNTDGNSKLPLAFQARVAVATALGVAAANANLLADQEELEIDNLVASIIDTQMKKLQSKLEHFEELEMLLEKERIEVDRIRQQVYADQLRYAEGDATYPKLTSHEP